jgi:hypothetical protein
MEGNRILKHPKTPCVEEDYLQTPLAEDDHPLKVLAKGDGANHAPYAAECLGETALLFAARSLV